MNLRIAFFAAASFAIFSSVAKSASIWIEGEAPARSSMQKHNWYDAVKRDVLSGGDWISHYGDKPGEAFYEVAIPADGEYSFFARLNPVLSEPKWRLDGGDWSAIATGAAQQQQNIAGDGKLDHRFIAWVKVGKIALKAGKHEIGFRFEGGQSNSGGLDCFVLTTDPFTPQGIVKPGAPSASTPAGPSDWFPLIADEDAFDPRSIIDMSALIPAPAGQFGFLKAKGDKLQFENAKAPIKLWGANANAEPGRYTREQLTQRARFLRKYGINAVREHPLFEEVTTHGVLDPKKLDAYDWWFAELKKHGIYSAWSVFYHFTIGPQDNYPAALFSELPAIEDRKDTYGLITASPKLWEIRNKWLAAILTHKNPYTGLRYVDDPALATVEMQNEDSIFFWNPLGELAKTDGKWPQHAKLLRVRFAEWVKARYKTNEALKAAWGDLKNGDSVDAKELAIMGPWELDGKGPRGPFAGETRRAGDYIQCLAEMQRGFYTDCLKVMRDAGFKGVAITTAWQVGGAATDAANLWTDSVGDMIDRHNYAGGGEGVHGIKEGKVNNESHLTHPGGGIFSTAMKQVEGKPFCMTEWTQSPPNQWKAECAPIMAFYGMGLQGWDASFHFTQSGTRLGDGWPGMSSYATDTPAFMGQFPALAFALYNGHITEGPVVAARRLSKEDLFSGLDPLKQDATKGGYDVKTMIVDGGTPLEAFAMGRVTVGFEGKTKQGDFTKYWKQANKYLESERAELVWYYYGAGFIFVQSPKTQAVIGNMGGDLLPTPALVVQVKTPWVSTIFTPLDNVPLKESKHILITALARDKQTGAKYNEDGTRLESAGTPPLLLEPVEAKIKIAGAKPSSVTPCDAYGVPMAGMSVPVAADGSFTIDGTYRAFYYEVKR